MTEKTFPCKQCGAKLEFKPGSTALVCPYCNTKNEIPQSEEDIRELDFHESLAQIDDADYEERQTIKCETCGASSTFDPHITSDACPFCGAPIVLSGGGTATRTLRPKSLLPFDISQKRALSLFRDWVGSLWFAPNALKNYAGMESKLVGMYVPYWTYDSNTTTFYHGERGDDYYVTETYTTTENGKSVTKTRQVRKTRWTSVSGTVWDTFDDVLVLASRSLPQKITEKLEPWDLENLTGYQDEFLSGFRAENYQIDLAEGFDRAKDIMDETIRQSIRYDIGGDHQRIHSLRSQYDNVTFKHILLPIWISSYRYKDLSYRFLVNGRTGEVQGERPWSWVKITLAVLGAAAVIGTVIALVN